MVNPRIIATTSVTLALLMNIGFAEVTVTELCNDRNCVNINTAYQSSESSNQSFNLRAAHKYVNWRPMPDNYNYQQQPRKQRSGWFFSRRSSERSTGRNWTAQVPSHGPANTHGTIVFDPRTLTYAAYDTRGDLVKAGHASGGSDWCADIGRPCHTPVGHFRVHSKGPEDCISKIYPVGEGGAPMPHCAYFNGGYAVHGSYEVPNHNASHGCIRLHPQDAEWLYHNFTRVGTSVIVRPYY